jgi:hypothetical protein
MYSIKKSKKNHLKLNFINPIKVEKIAKVGVLHVRSQPSPNVPQMRDKKHQ